MTPENENETSRRTTRMEKARKEVYEAGGISDEEDQVGMDDQDQNQNQNQSSASPLKKKAKVEIINQDFLEWNKDVVEPCFVIALEVLVSSLIFFPHLQQAEQSEIEPNQMRLFRICFFWPVATGRSWAFDILVRRTLTTQLDVARSTLSLHLDAFP